MLDIKYKLHFYFLSVSSNVLFLSRIQLRIHILLSCLLSSSNLWWFFTLPLSFMVWTNLKSTGKWFCIMPLDLGLSDVSSWWDWGYVVWGRIQQKVSLSVHHVRGHGMSVCLNSGNVTLNYLVKVVSAGPLHYFFVLYN